VYTHPTVFSFVLLPAFFANLLEPGSIGGVIGKAGTPLVFSFMGYYQSENKNCYMLLREHIYNVCDKMSTGVSGIAVQISVVFVNNLTQALLEENSASIGWASGFCGSSR
jgi:hypothetical protein